MIETPSGSRPISPEASTRPHLPEADSDLLVPTGAPPGISVTPAAPFMVDAGPGHRQVVLEQPQESSMDMDKEGRQDRQIPEDRILALIERVALDPSADVGKLSQLMDLRERWKKEKAEEAYNQAKGRVLSQLTGIKIVKRRVVSYQQGKEAFKYAPLEEIDKVLSPLLAAEQMDLSYSDEPMADGRVLIRGRLKHLPLGHFEDSTLFGPVDSSGGKNAVQAIGSTNSYLRRYVACNLFNIVVIGDDDDGTGGPMGDAQITELVDLMIQANVGPRFQRYMKWPVFDKDEYAVKLESAGSPEAMWDEYLHAVPGADYGKAKSALMEQIAKQQSTWSAMIGQSAKAGGHGSAP